MVGVAAAAIAVLAAFLPWYAPDLGPPLTPDSVSGWEATVAAKILVAAGVIHVLAGLALIADARDVLALDSVAANALAAVCVLAAGAGVAAVGYRTIRLPEPEAILAREPGLYLALAMSLVALVAALSQLVVTAGTGTGGPGPAGTRRGGR